MAYYYGLPVWQIAVARCMVSVTIAAKLRFSHRVLGTHAVTDTWRYILYTLISMHEQDHMITQVIRMM